MADEDDTDARVDAMLTGWGTPPARPELVDRVLARVEPPVVASRRRWALPFALGGALGAMVTAVAMTADTSGPRVDGPPVHLQAPGIGDVVGEPGTQLAWMRGANGELVLEIVEGVAWIRVAAEGPALGVVADGESIALEPPCSRVEVTRSLLSVDVAIDGVECARVDTAIERVRAELSAPASR